MIALNNSRVMLRITSDDDPVVVCEVASQLVGQVGPLHIKQDVVLKKWWWSLFLRLKEMGHQIFWDQRMGDVDETLFRGSKAFAELGVWGFSINSFQLTSRAIEAVVKSKGEARLFVTYSPNSDYVGWSRRGVQGVVLDEWFGGHDLISDTLPHIVISSLHDTGSLFPAALIGPGVEYVSVSIQDFLSGPAGFVSEIQKLNGAIEEQLDGAALLEYATSVLSTDSGEIPTCPYCSQLIIDTPHVCRQSHGIPL